MGGGVEGLCPNGVGVAWEKWAWLCVKGAWPERGGRGLGVMSDRSWGGGVAWMG